MIFLTIMPLIYFGTMEDMEELIAERQEAGASSWTWWSTTAPVITNGSKEEGPDGPYADCYFIESDKEPNNWEGLTVFGEPVPEVPTNTISILSTRISRISIGKNLSCAKEIYRLIGGWTRELQASDRCHYQHQKDLE